MNLDLVFAAPIPIGHRVTIRWYKRGNAGFFGSGEETRPHEPAIEDLDTGIIYTSDWYLPMPGVKHPGQPIPVGEGVKEHVVVERTISGRVVACRIITIRWSDYDVQTQLTITPLEEPGTYRG